MNTRRKAGNVVKTTVFLVLFWATFVFAVPIAISIAEIELGIQRFPPFPAVAALLLLVGTLISTWAAVSLAIEGDGTPLAFDPPRKLVTSGPYAYIRHPFAAAATMQIVAYAMALGSVPVLGYAAVAMAFWYFVIRPREERDIDARFGRDAREYRKAVRGFRPRLTRYRVR